MALAMTNFGFDEQQSLDQMNFAEKRLSSSIPHILAQEPPCLGSPGSWWAGSGRSFIHSLALGDCSIVLQYKPKSNIVQNTLSCLNISLICIKRDHCIYENFLFLFSGSSQSSLSFLVVYTWGRFIDSISPCFLIVSTNECTEHNISTALFEFITFCNNPCNILDEHLKDICWCWKQWCIFLLLFF